MRKKMIPVRPSINEEAIRQNQVLQLIVNLSYSLLKENQNLQEKLPSFNKGVITNQVHLIQTNPPPYRNFFETVSFTENKGIIYKIKQLNLNDIDLSCSSSSNPVSFGIENIFIEDSNTYWCSYPILNSNFTVHFRTHQVSLDSYILFSYINYFPSGWKLEGSNDNSNWSLIDNQTNQYCFTAQQNRQTFTCTSSYFFSYFKITSTQPNSDYDSDHFCIAYFELSGRLKFQ
jgi:hypothetical protein